MPESRKIRSRFLVSRGPLGPSTWAVVVAVLMACSALAAPVQAARHGSAGPGPSSRLTVPGGQSQAVHLTPPPRTTATRTSQRAAAPPAGSHLTFHSGPVAHTLKAYAIYWQPLGYHFEEPYSAGAASDALDTRYETLINRFFKDAGATPYFNILTQYSDTSDQVHNQLSFGGQWVDTGALNQFAAGDAGTSAQPLFDSDIQSEITRALAANPSWTQGGLAAEYFVFTPAGVQSCVSNTFAQCDAEFTTSSSRYCAYHSAFYSGGYRLYSNMFDAGYSTACGGPNWTVNGVHYPPIDGPGPNGDAVADYEISPTSHEMSETITDPLPNSGWVDSSDGYEIGDICAYVYAPLASQGDVVLHGHRYLIQEEWSNAPITEGSIAQPDCTMSYARPTTLPVNSNADSVTAGGSTPLCSNTPGGDAGSNASYMFRCAVGDANSDALAGFTGRKITLTGCAAPCAITLKSLLPAVTAKNLTLSSAGNGQLLGNHAVATGLVIRAAGVSVAGLTIKNFTADGIDVRGPVNGVSIGGLRPDVIQSNGGVGVSVGATSTDPSMTVIRRTPIFANTKGGILLTGLPPASCLTGAKSPAPNGYLPCPSISQAHATSVTGGSSCASCAVDVFAVPATPDPTGHGQAQKLIGIVTTAADGSWSLTPSVSLAGGSRVTATVTNLTAGTTSEFSANVTVT